MKDTYNFFFFFLDKERYLELITNKLPLLILLNIYGETLKCFRCMLPLSVGSTPLRERERGNLHRKHVKPSRIYGLQDQ